MRKLLLLWPYAVALAVILIVSLTVQQSVAQAIGCGPPPQPQPEKEVIIIWLPVFVFIREVPEEAPSCADHFFELGLRGFAVDTGGAYSPYKLVEATIDGRSPRLWKILDIAGGFSFGYVQDQGIAGFNIKLGIPFSNPGPSFDIFRFSWMMNRSLDLDLWDGAIKFPICWISYGDLRVMGYVGANAYALDSDPTGPSEGYSFFLGGMVEICGQSISGGAYVEVGSGKYLHGCSALYKGAFMLEAGVRLWFF